jgi:hypothetical protein
MEIINVIKSATFAELNDEQKKQACEIMRDIEISDSNCSWADDEVDYLKEQLVEYGITDANVQWSGFGSQGDGASVSTDHVNIEKFLRKVKSWSKFRALHKLIADEQLSLKVYRGNHRYSHEYCVSGSLQFYWSADYTNKQMELGTDLENLLTEVIRDLSRGLYKSLESEYDYRLTDEALTEMIECNDYQFSVDSNEKVLELL